MNEITAVDELDVETIVDNVLMELPSSGSQRVYANTYQKWLSWSEETGTHPLMLTVSAVKAFLVAQRISVATRQQELCSLRKLAHHLALHYQGYDVIYEELKGFQVPTENLGGRERSKIPLTSEQVEKVLRYWLKLPKPAHALIYARNHALVCVAIATGARRSEITAIQWRDVDLENGIIHIRHGKGDKARDVALVGDFGVEALQKWRSAQGDGFEYVFSPTNRGGIAKFDKPLNATVYYKMVKDMAAALGYDFTTHDFRRTLIMELLRMKAPQRDVQEQAGHSHPSTTQRYAQAADASSRREEFRVGWSS
jgi:integrase